MTDFKIFSGLLKASELDGRKYISTTASSSVTDRHGDEMTPDAIRSMAAQAASSRMTIFLNHEYRVPEDVFGTVVAANAAQRGTAWDLNLGVVVDETNPRAVATYKQLRGPNDDGNGVKLGVSIGALIRDYELKKKEDPWGPMTIKDVELLEASIVGIPANPDSWVKQATKSIRRSMTEKPAETDEKGEEKAEPSETANTYDEIVLADVEPEIVASISETDAKDAEDAEEAAEVPLEDDVDRDAPDALDALDNLTKSIDDEPTTTPVELATEEQPADAPVETASVEPDAEELAVMSLTSKVMEFAEKLSDRDREIARLKHERDDAVASLRLAMQFVEKLARTPLGKKTSFAEPISTFRSKFGAVYDEEFLKFLENTNES